MEKKWLSFQTVLDGISGLDGSTQDAVICGNERITYHEMISEAKRAARGLAAKGVRKGDRIVLMMPYSVDFVCAYLSILYAGAVYVAVDLNWPGERIEWICENCGAVLTMTRDEFDSLRKMNTTDKTLPPVNRSDAFAVYYTPDSTGKLKGAVIHHLNVLSMVLPVPENAGFFDTYERCDTVFSVMDMACPAALGDVVFSLLCGKTLILAAEKERLSPALTGECMSRNHADAISLAPSLLMRFLEDRAFAAAFAAVKRVFLVGETVSEAETDAILDKTQGVVYHVYEEAEVGFFACGKVSRGRKADLQYAAPQSRLLVVREDGIQAAEGEKGELYVGGGLAEYGLYQEDPELTERKYVRFADEGRFFRTGDAAVLDDGGVIQVTGRMDERQMLYGQQVEPRETELAMERFEGVEKAAAQVRGTGNTQALCAWYSCSGPVDKVDKTMLRSFLARILPWYMIPTRMLQIGEFPLLPCGKPDKSLLPDPGEKEQVRQLPVTAAEFWLCQAFSEVLHRGFLTGRDENFFLIGGDEKLGMLLLGRLASEKGLICSMKDLFLNPTPARLAASASKGENRGTKVDKNSRIPWKIPDELRLIAEDNNTLSILPVDKRAAQSIGINRSEAEEQRNEERLEAVLNCAWSEEEFSDRISAVIRNHPVLRTSFALDRSGIYWQVLLKNLRRISIRRLYPEGPLEYFWYKDIRHLSKEAAQRFMSGFWQVMGAEPALWKIAYFVLSEGKSAMLLCVSHAIVDEASLFILIRELCADNYGDFAEDGLISYTKRRIEACLDTPVPQWVQEYYKDPGDGFPAKPPVTDAGGRDKSFGPVIRLSREETDRLKESCLTRGMMPGTWIRYCYGRALLEQSDAPWLWMMIPVSGRFMDEGEDLRAAGSFAFSLPVKMTREKTAGEFQEELERLMSCPSLSGSDLLPPEGWEGMGWDTEEDLLLTTPSIERICRPEGQRAGGSMSVKDGQLVVELNCADLEPDAKKTGELIDRFMEYLKREPEETEDG